MKHEQRAEQLREALATVERKGAGRPYPVSLRQAAMEYCHQREQQGANINGIALELGVSTTSLMRWSRKAAKSAEGFRAVELVVEPESHVAVSKPARLAAGVSVHGPRGLRVEGLTIAELAELIDRLS